YAHSAYIDGIGTTTEVTPFPTRRSSGLVEGSALAYSVVANASHGSVLLNGSTGSYTYTPVANYNGPDSFTFKANDGSLDSNVATVNLTVTAVNDAPIASGGSFSTAEDTA